ncbi:hypothetical protein GCM10010246_75230 [Streptomyces cuspidosporus]|uniref:Uncharacterized protein n=1 Tax=Streptomyces cuspidosporus TaxID=66882 RepID=A0ABP5U5M5_9ACTN
MTRGGDDPRGGTTRGGDDPRGGMTRGGTTRGGTTRGEYPEHGQRGDAVSCCPSAAPATRGGRPERGGARRAGSARYPTGTVSRASARRAPAVEEPFSAV